MIDDLIKQVAEEMANRRDMEVLDALGRLGYKFKGQKELHQFVEIHCHIVQQGDVRTLQVDGEDVATWSEKVTTTFEGNKINIKIG